MGGTGSAGSPISATASGWSTSFSLTQSLVVTVRTPVKRRRKSDPVTAWGRATSTVSTPFSNSLSMISGSGTRATTVPSTDTSTSVGTEWRPSATTVSGMVSTVTGSVRSTSTHCRCGSARTVVQAVAGSPSNAAAGVWTSPFSRELARTQVTEPSWGRPRVSSMT